MQFRVEAYYRPQHGDQRELLTTPEDVDLLIDALLAGPTHQNLAELHSLERSPLPSGTPDHELLVGADRTLQVGVLEFMDASGNWTTVGSHKGRAEVRYSCVHQMTEFPARSEIPIALLSRAVKEFCLSGGQRPTCVQWERPEFW
ncbi:Imm1 family immunity protein [Micromonospora avicenniae]|uniref:Imm1 family immunity protein n=1 Tax=Micromonospora avicenniae TaxID=1198245 RepID=UPI00333427A0